MPRLVAIQGELEANGAEPLYRHPADEQPKLVPFTPFVDAVRKAVQAATGQRINHVLVQWYKSGTDYISVSAHHNAHLATTVGHHHSLHVPIPNALPLHNSNTRTRRWTSQGAPPSSTPALAPLES